MRAAPELGLDIHFKYSKSGLSTGQTAVAVFPHGEPCFSPGSVHLTQKVVLWAEMSSPACLDCDGESSIAAGQLAPSSL